MSEPQVLSYTIYNSPGTETILLIHGAFGNSAEWDQVLPSLSKTHHILTPDLPAHGASSHIPFTVDLSAKLILDLITEHAHNARAHIVGYSLGAHVAARVAEFAAPGQVSSLIACGYNSFTPPKMVIPFLSPVVFMLTHFVLGVTDPRAEWEVLGMGTCSLALSGAVVHALCEGRELGSISARTLVVAATGEIFMPNDKLDSARELFRVVGGGFEGCSRVVQHRGMKHAWLMIDPDLFADMVLDWVEGSELSSSFEDVQV